MRALLRKGTGIFLIIAGIVMAFLPILPGFVFIAIGLELLGVTLLPWKRIKFRLTVNKDKDQR